MDNGSRRQIFTHSKLAPAAVNIFHVVEIDLVLNLGLISENTFRITDPCSEFLSSYNLISHVPRLQFNATAWIGKLSIAVPATARLRSTARYSAFIRSLVSCPTIRKVEIDIRVWSIEAEDGFRELRNVTATVAVLTKAFTELQSRIGRGLRLWIVAMSSKTEKMVQDSEISWLFQP
jgi:hypothetical protein